MKRPGKRLLRLIAAGILAVPILWLSVVYLMPTGWIRDRVAARLKESTGHEVRLGGLQIRPLGGVVVTALDFASPKSPDDPWLKVATLNVDVCLGKLICGHVETTACQASGVTLRIRRDSAGALEIDDLFHRKRKENLNEKTSHDMSEDDDPEIALEIRDATMIVIDEPTDTRLEFTEVHGRASYNKTSAAVNELTGNVNGGTFDLAARLDKEMDRTLDAEFKARDVNLGMGMKSLAYLIPLLASTDATAHARGVLALDLDLHARGESNEALGRSMKGKGRLVLDGMNLDDSRILNEIQDVLPIPTAGKSGSLSGTFQIVDRKVSTADTILKVADIPVNLAGWSDFDGKLDYLVQCEKIAKAVNKIASRLPPEARELLAGLPVEDLGSIADIKVYGTINSPKVKAADGSLLSKRNAPKDPTRRAPDKAKVKEAGRRLLDRVLR